MKKVLLAFLLFLSLSTLYAQKQGLDIIDSLKLKLQNSADDTGKVRMLGKISFQYFRFDTDSGIAYGERALRLAEKLHWGLGKAFSNNYIGTNYAVKGNHPKALDYFNRSLSEYTSIGDKQGIAFICNNLCNFYRMQKEYPRAIEYGTKAMVINQELRSDAELSKNYNNLGFVYCLMNDYVKSNDYYNKGLKIETDLNNQEMMANLYINLAENKMKQREYCDALDVSLKALKISEDLKIPYDCAVYGSQVGQIYLILSEDSVKIDKCKFYCADKKQYLAKAKEYLTKSLKLIDKINDLTLISETSLLLSKAYEKSGDTKNALLFYKQYSENKDSVYSKDNALQIAEIEKKQEVELKDKQIEIQSLEIEKKNSQIVSQVVVFILILLLVAFSYSVYSKKRKIQAAVIEKAEKEQANKVLRESEERFRTLYEDSPVGLYRTTPQGKILLANPSLCKMLGYASFAELAKRNLEESGFEPSYPRMEFIKNIEANGEIKDLESVWVCKDGSLITVKENAKVIYDSGDRALYYDGTIEDVTEKKDMVRELIAAKEKAESANKLKDAFIANMSHEIRTPLNGILGVTSVLKEIYSEYSTKDEDRYFMSIERSSERLIKTVDQILNFSRLQVGDYQLNTSELYLVQILQKLVDKYYSTASAKSLELRFQSDCKEVAMQGDEYALTTVFGNLIENAIKFTDSGSVDITLYKDSNEHWCVDIRDTGIGISEDYMKYLFEPYTQEQIGYSRPYEGLGLGLPIVKKLLALGGSSISVKSKKDFGTLFTVTCGGKNEDAVEDKEEAQEFFAIQNTNVSKIPASKKMSVLVVEDDAVNQLYIKSVLSGRCEVVISRDAVSAFKAYRSESFDLILMDISLGKGLNGLELTKEIRSGKKNPEIPIIAVTGHAFPDDIKKAKEAGCNEFIAKPFTSYQLIEKIERFIEV